MTRTAAQIREDLPEVRPLVGTVRTRANPSGLASARSRVVARLGRLIDAPPPAAGAERFAGHLANEFRTRVLVLCDRSIDVTNWRAEQAIRPAVVTRKVCGGDRTRRGADTQQVLVSVGRTARQGGLDPRPLITTLRSQQVAGASAAAWTCRAP